MKPQKHHAALILFAVLAVCLTVIPMILAIRSNRPD
ncbi:MAG: hypothetical protein MOGMAGMI_01443 [Candidatus Omnitrophica bacterium]|nr:hypothetical protein [Candidatus Omnitrophota bacterium]